MGQGAEPRVGSRVPPQAPASFFCARRRRPSGGERPVGERWRRLLAQKNEGGPEVVGAGGAGVLPGVLHLAARLVHLRQVEPTDRRVIPQLFRLLVDCNY